MKKVQQKWIDFLKSKINIKNKTNLIVIIGCIGIGLILISTMFSGEKPRKIKPIKELSIDTQDYENQIKKELIGILSTINGVGKVDIMLTVEGSTEYVFAEEQKHSFQEGNEKYSEDFQNEYIVIDDGNGKKALVKKIMKPQATGVIVVCEGGDSPVVNEKIMHAVSAVLNLPMNKICVVRRY